MMFQVNSAFAVGLIALAAGTALLAWVYHAHIQVRAVKMVGFFIVITSLLGQLCIFYYTLKYRSWGLFDDPDKVMVGKPGMGMMDKCPP